MILYHGSTMEVSQPRILKSEIGRDFGFAFYTTDIQAQAERWARRRAMIESRRTKTEIQAIVSVYEWDDSAAKHLQFLQFDGVSMEWLELVVTCRSRTDYSHGYDIVEGKIANDNVGEQFLTSCRESCAKKTPSSGCGLNRSIIKSHFVRKPPCTRFIFRTAISAGV